MKKVHVLSRPTSVEDIDMIETDNFDTNWDKKADRVRLQKWRRVKHQLV